VKHEILQAVHNNPDVLKEAYQLAFGQSFRPRPIHLAKFDINRAIAAFNDGKCVIEASPRLPLAQIFASSESEEPQVVESDIPTHTYEYMKT
jgi:hypothetical protein